MSLKIYNGIKFRSSDMTEIAAALYKIKDQAIANSNAAIIKNPGQIVHVMIENGFIKNSEELFMKEFSAKDYMIIGNMVRDSLDHRFRDILTPDFNFSIAVIPWTDGNVYGIVYYDRIQANYDLLKDIADDFYYQNQTDRPEEIDDDEWNERSSVWNEIFDKYFSASEAGFIKEIVTSYDLDFDTVEKAIAAFKDERILGFSTDCKFLKEVDKERTRALLDALDAEPDIFQCNFSWYSKSPRISVYCKDVRAKEQAEKILSGYSDMVSFELVESHVPKKFFTEEYQNHVKEVL